MLRFFCSVLAVLALFSIAPDARAVEPNEVLKDPKMERRARDISLELRCLVCQNQSIDDSNAPLAKDLRVLVRERLTAGDSNAQVLDYVVARYGEFVLLRPRFATHTLVLWLGPPLLLLIAIFAIYRAYRVRQAEAEKKPPKKLSATEKRKIKRLLAEE